MCPHQWFPSLQIMFGRRWVCLVEPLLQHLTDWSNLIITKHGHFLGPGIKDITLYKQWTLFSPMIHWHVSFVLQMMQDDTKVHSEEQFLRSHKPSGGQSTIKELGKGTYTLIKYYSSKSGQSFIVHLLYKMRVVTWFSFIINPEFCHL